MLEVIFEHNPPFQMINKHGQGYGPVYEFAKKLVKEANIPAKFYGKPWARIIEKDGKTANKLILSISKTPNRANHFIWLSNIYKGQQYFWKVKGRFDPLNKPLLVSVERHSHKVESMLAYFHQDHIVESLDTEQALSALLKGRVDRYVGMPFAVNSKLKALGSNILALQRLEHFNEAQYASSGLYLALTQGTDKDVVVALHKALKKPSVVEARGELIAGFKAAEQALVSN